VSSTTDGLWLTDTVHGVTLRGGVVAPSRSTQGDTPDPLPPIPPPLIQTSLVDQIAAVAGRDPMMLGATAYGDNVFTLRLWGGTA
jgi:hypothetical protein